MMKLALRTAMPLLPVFVLACGGEAPDAPSSQPATTADAEPTMDPPDECTLGEGVAPGSFDATDWTGEYALVLLGPDAVRVEGSLTLVEQAPELQSVVGPGGEVAANTRMPLYGWADIDLDPAGAAVPGSLASEDPGAPGVILLESTVGDQAPRLMLRLGAEANRRGQTRFDGAFTVLRITEAAADGFRGRWSSGVGLDRAEGTFCAFAR